MRIPVIGAIGILLPVLLSGCSGMAADTPERPSSALEAREEAESQINEAAVRQVVRMILTVPGPRAGEAFPQPEPEETSLAASSMEDAGSDDSEPFAPFFTENGLEAFRANRTPARLHKLARKSGYRMRVTDIQVSADSRRPDYCTYTAKVECSGQEQKSRSFSILGDALFQEEDGVHKIDSFWMDYSFYWELGDPNEN